MKSHFLSFSCCSSKLDRDWETEFLTLLLRIRFQRIRTDSDHFPLKNSEIVEGKESMLISAFMQASRSQDNRMWHLHETDLVARHLHFRFKRTHRHHLHHRLSGLSCETTGGGLEIKNHTIHGRPELLVAKGDLGLHQRPLRSASSDFNWAVC